jgi:hypothetical protein
MWVHFKIGADYSPEMLTDFGQTERRYIPEGSNLHCREDDYEL